MGQWALLLMPDGTMQLRWLQAKLDGAKLRLQRVKESAEFGYAEQHEIRDAEYTVSEAEHRLQLQIQADREARLSAS